MNTIEHPQRHLENSTKLRAAAALLATFLAANALGRQTENAIVIDAKDSATPTAPVASLSKYLIGFHSSIDGQTIEYHSSDPDADSALLVRGQRMAHTVSWQTDPLPEPSGDSYQFIWLAGIECAGFAEEKESHQFNLLINGQLWFTFKNAKDARAKAWQIAGKDGAELSFVATIADHVGDLFGYMTLKLPANDFPPRHCTRQLVELARPLNVTFHRAFDMSVDLFQSLEDVCATGADRLLTSGGEQKCLQGAETIARLAKSARGRIAIMAGGGIGHHDAAAIIERTGVREIHVGLSTPVPSPMRHHNPRLSMGKVQGREYERVQVLEENVRNLESAILLAKI